jgi:CBS domain-containing protein
MKVSNLLEVKGSDVHKVKDNDTVFTALELLAMHDIGALLVVDKKDKIAGIFSERDYARKVSLHGKSSKNTKVKDMMTTTLFFVKPENNLWECLDIMTKKRTRHLPVIKDQELVGLLSIGDIVNRIITEQKSTIENLESYIVGSDYGATIKMPS